MLPFGFSSTYAGLVTSQPVYPRASNVLRSPPLGELDASGSPCIRDLPPKLGERRTVGDRFEEAVVLLSGQTGQRVEDVRVVGRAFFQRPVLHRGRHGVGDHGIEQRSTLDGRHDRLVDRLGQALPHHDLAENVLAENLARSLGVCEADGGRRIGLDVVDRLQTDGVSAHFRASRPGIDAPKCFEEPGRRTLRRRYNNGVSLL